MVCEGFCVVIRGSREGSGSFCVACVQLLPAAAFILSRKKTNIFHKSPWFLSELQCIVTNFVCKNVMHQYGSVNMLLFG